MTNLMPANRLDIRDYVLDSEFTLADWQVARINDAMVGHPRHTRWWIAPEGTTAPGPTTEQINWMPPAETVLTTAELLDPDPYAGMPAPLTGYRLTEPWLEPWMQLNDPGDDTMTGMCVLDQTNAARGLLIMVDPTPEMRIAWDTYASMGPDSGGAPRFASLGSEAAIQVPWPNVDYRAVFRHVWPAAQVSKNAVRWHFERPAPGVSSWDVLTGGWKPGRTALR